MGQGRIVLVTHQGQYRPGEKSDVYSCPALAQTMKCTVLCETYGLSACVYVSGQLVQSCDKQILIYHSDFLVIIF